MAIRSTFLPGSQLLSVFDDSLDNNITVSRNAAGTILVNGGAVPVLGGTSTVANTSLIQVFGTGGNDVIALNEANGALPAANLFGGAGDDQMFGQAGDDRMIWNPGDDSDLMEGGDGIDTAEVNGGNGSEVFTITANGDRVRFDRVSPAFFIKDMATTEN